MINLWLTLAVKSTGILMLGLLASQMLRSRSAAIRHLVWLTTLCALLLLPLGLVVPKAAVPSPWKWEATTATYSFRSMRGTKSDSWLLWLWAAGVGIFAARLAIAGWRDARIVNSTKRFGAYDGFEIRVAHDIRTPMAWSFGPGFILLPPDAARWETGCFSAAIRHEVAHLRRRDCQSSLAGELACAVYWFHPLVWHARRQMRSEQEYAADDFVLRGGAEAANYAGQLLTFVRCNKQKGLLAGAGTRSTLAGRVEAILDNRRRRTVLSKKMVTASLAAALAITVPLWAVQASRKTYKIGDGVSAPKLIYKQEPTYTPDARDAKIEGKVVLSGVIETDGHLTEVRVERGLDSGLDTQAVQAVYKWQFSPAEKDGQAVPLAVKIEVNFRLL